MYNMPTDPVLGLKPGYTRTPFQGQKSSITVCENNERYGGHFTTRNIDTEPIYRYIEASLLMTAEVGNTKQLVGRLLYHAWLRPYENNKSTALLEREWCHDFYSKLTCVSAPEFRMGPFLKSNPIQLFAHPILSNPQQ